MNSELYHENSHLETSPWSPHWSDEGPAVLFGVITLHSPQTLLSVVASYRNIKMHRGFNRAFPNFFLHFYKSVLSLAKAKQLLTR